MQAHAEAASLANAELEKILETRSAAEQAYVEKVIATTDGSQNALREQRTADTEEYKVLKSRHAQLPAVGSVWAAAFTRPSKEQDAGGRLEEQLHALEAESGIMRATYQVNTEKLVYNCRVLAERAQESAAGLSLQKRRLSRQRDLLSGIKVSSAAAIPTHPLERLSASLWPSSRSPSADQP